MSTFTRGLMAGAVLAGAAVGLAGPATADPTAGAYTATIIDPGASHKTGSVIWNLEPCGQDCFHLATISGSGWELHRQGNGWTGTGSDGNPATLDNDSLILTLQKPGDPNIVIGLTKNG